MDEMGGRPLKRASDPLPSLITLLYIEGKVCGTYPPQAPSKQVRFNFPSIRRGISRPIRLERVDEMGGRHFERLPRVCQHQLAQLPRLAEREAAQAVLNKLGQEKGDFDDGAGAAVLFLRAAFFNRPARIVVFWGLKVGFSEALQAAMTKWPRGEAPQQLGLSDGSLGWCRVL
jgi:hypothetical protein